MNAIAVKVIKMMRITLLFDFFGMFSIEIPSHPKRKTERSHFSTNVDPFRDYLHAKIAKKGRVSMWPGSLSRPFFLCATFSVPKNARASCSKSSDRGVHFLGIGLRVWWRNVSGLSTKSTGNKIRSSSLIFPEANSLKLKARAKLELTSMKVWA